MRKAGVLMPISALPSDYGIGTLGKEARNFINFLYKAGQSYWQILPTGPTGYGDSPYQSFSSFAGNPYYIDLDDLAKDNYLLPEEYAHVNFGNNTSKVDYGQMYQTRFTVLKKAVNRLLLNPPASYQTFLQENTFWLEDYALFMALKDAHHGQNFHEWEEDIRTRKPEALSQAKQTYKEAIDFYQGIQYFFFEQMTKLKDYAHDHNIELIGDIPIYVSSDSSDVWGDPSLFQLDENLKPIDVAGCPPDAFAADGQLWGNPLYAWDTMKKDDYAWWCKRIAFQFKIVDVLRIDHFRGFESYYAIPYGEPTARNGKWQKGPGIDFFKTIEKKLGKLNIIAEDLGFLTKEVKDMVKETGYPGMKILEFAFDMRDSSGSDYLPYKYDHNCIVYCGTHDNETVMGWMEDAPKDYVENAINYMHLTKEEGYNWGFIRTAFASVSDTAIMQMQDILGLGNEARFNVPSTTGTNWLWRCNKEDFSDELAMKLYHLTKLYGRLPLKEKSQ